MKKLFNARGEIEMLYLHNEKINLQKDMNLIYKKIEETRLQLNKLVEEKYDNITDSEVVKLSQKLDKLLVKYVKITQMAS